MTIVLRSLRCVCVCHLIAIIILIPLKLDNWNIPMRTIFVTFFFFAHTCSVPCAQSMAHAINSSRSKITYHKYLSIDIFTSWCCAIYSYIVISHGCMMRVIFRSQRRLVSQLENMRMRWWKSLQSIREQTCDHEFGAVFVFLFFTFHGANDGNRQKNRINLWKINKIEITFFVFFFSFRFYSLRKLCKRIGSCTYGIDSYVFVCVCVGCRCWCRRENKFTDCYLFCISKATSKCAIRQGNEMSK